MAQSVINAALAAIDAQIADLERAKAIIVASAGPSEAAPKQRKPRKKKGLPADSGI